MPSILGLNEFDGNVADEAGTTDDGIISSAFLLPIYFIVYACTCTRAVLGRCRVETNNNTRRTRSGNDKKKPDTRICVRAYRKHWLTPLRSDARETEKNYSIDADRVCTYSIYSLRCSSSGHGTFIYLWVFVIPSRSYAWFFHFCLFLVSGFFFTSRVSFVATFSGGEGLGIARIRIMRTTFHVFKTFNVPCHRYYRYTT